MLLLASTLTKESITHLKNLTQGLIGFPPPGVIDTWALLLNTSREAIIDWLTTHNPQSDLSPMHHLPTPASTSPEPSPITASNFNPAPIVKADPLHSPVVTSRPSIPATGFYVSTRSCSIFGALP